MSAAQSEPESDEIVPRDQIGNGQGRLNDIAVVTMEREIKRWLALKYGFVCVDEQNCAVYRIHPLDWEEGDFDYVQRWNEFLFGPRAMWKARELVFEGRKRGVNTVALHAYFPLPKKKIAWPWKVGGAVAALGFARWLFAPPKLYTPKGMPEVDIGPLEDVLREDARMKPRARPKPDEDPSSAEEPEEESAADE
jgi:hypothetical protein